MSNEEIIRDLLSSPDKLLMKKPFTRGGKIMTLPAAIYGDLRTVDMNETVRASLPKFKKIPIPQEQYLLELDPECHKVLFDQNIPSITMKLNDGNWAEIKYKKMSIPFQRIIKDKHVLHLCGNKMQFTMMRQDPTEQQVRDFATFKQYWEQRNQDGMRTKLVNSQLSCGDGGLLYYFDRNGRIKSKLISFMDGYVLCPHNDENGDRILESVYYCKDGVEYIDSYDDMYMYRYRNDGSSADTDGWYAEAPVLHGFDEIPLVTKRGLVAWDNVQNITEVYEVIYNIFMVVQKRHGWGVLYVKGKFDTLGEKVAGAIILNDSNVQSPGDAKFLTPPDPQGMLDTMQLLEESIQKGSGTTFLLPKDVKMSGDISGIAIQLTQSLDNEKAMQGVIDWQNVADKMARLFKQGLAKELVNKGLQLTAITDFENLDISAKFKAWRPRNDIEYNTMLETMYKNGILSQKTAIQKNTESSPDEEVRISLETLENDRKEIEKLKAQAQAQQKTPTNAPQNDEGDEDIIDDNN